MDNPSYMLKRKLQPHIQKLAKKYPIVTILGPRQSGKTTLARTAFPDKPYVNMEDAENRALATSDPKSFLQAYPDGAVLDEVQRVPHLLSYLQVLVDEQDRKGMFILTGSHQVDLHAAITQSLAGRTVIVRLLPLSLQEIREAGVTDTIEEIILKGGYPRIYKDDLPISPTYSSYFQTYVERDVRQILHIKDLLAFERFVKLTASRVGQLVNYVSLASDVGVSPTTIKEWIFVLEATYLLVRLEPYFENFGKRMIKSPKIYFADTGLVCHLLGITHVDQLVKDPLYGNIFENWVVIELMKSCYNEVIDPPFYFYRDVAGQEVDLIAQRGSFLTPIEIKSGKTFSPAFLKGLKAFHKKAAARAVDGAVIYGGEKSQIIGTFELVAVEQCTKVVASVTPPFPSP